MAIAAAIVLFVAGAGTFELLSQQTASASTVLTILSGTAEVARGSRPFQPASDGAILDPGDAVRTGDRSHAIVTFFDGSTIELEPLATVRIDNATTASSGALSITLSQTLGRTWSSVHKLTRADSKYELKTPSSIASVRGTGFEVDVSSTGASRVQTTDGSVTVQAQGQTVVVNPGTQTTVQVGAAPAPPVAAPPPPNRLRFGVHSPAYLAVVDPLGRACGLVMPGPTLVRQIPGCIASDAGVEPQLVEVPNAPTGTYQLSVAPRGAGGAYQLQAAATGGNANDLTFNFVQSGTIHEGERQGSHMDIDITPDGSLTTRGLSGIAVLERSPVKAVVHTPAPNATTAPPVALDQLFTPLPRIAFNAGPLMTPAVTPNATITPGATASPAATPSPTPAPTATPSPSTTPSPTPTATPSAAPTPTPSPSATPTPSPTPAPTASPTSSPTASPTGSPTPVPTATPSPAPTPVPPQPPAAVLPPTSFWLAVTNGTGGTVTNNVTGINCGAACGGWYASGAVVSLTATPNAGYRFAGWGGDCAGTGLCTVTMDAPHSVTAAWYASISGHITSTGTATPVSGIPVVAYTDATSLAAATVAASTTTDVTGAYQLYPPPGSYRLFVGPLLGYVNRWYGGSDYTSASPVAIGSNPIVIDTTVEVASTITGTVWAADTGVPLAGVVVTPNAATGCVTETAAPGACARTTTDASGKYTLYVPSGSYALIFSPSTDLYARQWWPGVSVPSGVTTVTAAYLGSATANLSLPPTAPITGHVTNGLGVGVGGVSVRAHPRDGGFVYAGTTAIDGSYTVRVADGTYDLEFTPPVGSAYGAVYNGGATSGGTAPAVSAPTTVNATLPAGTPLIVTVLAPNGVTPVESSVVRAFIGPSGGPGYFVTSAFSDSLGHATLQLANTGSYRLYASAPYGSSYVGQFLGGTVSPELSPDIASGTTTATIVLASGHLVSGSVTNSVTAAGVFGAWVSAVPATCTGCSNQFSAMTRVGGAYSVRVPDTGSYKIVASAPHFVTGYYGGATFSTAIAITPVADMTSINISLTPFGTIAGTITGPAGPVSGAVVTAYQFNGTGGLQYVTTTTDVAGAYRFDVAPGSYKVLFAPPLASGAASGWWSGTSAPALSMGAAYLQVLGAGGTVTANVTLAAASYLQGTVTSASGPVASAWVYAYTSGADQIVFTRTNGSGSYQLALPSSIAVRLAIYPPYGSTLINRWYNPATAGYTANDAANVFTGAVGTTTTLVTTTLDPARHISGTVTDTNGHPIGNVGVSAYVGGASPSCCHFVRFAQSDASTGAYTLTLPPGVYRLYFSPPAGYLGAYRSDTVATGVTDWASASNIDVTLGDFPTSPLTSVQKLASGVVISGKITQAGAATVAYASVSVYTSAGAWVTSAGADANGAYAVTVDGTTTYRLQARPPYANTTLAPIWNGGATDISVASNVIAPATVGAPPTHMDFVLPPGYTVTGTLTDSAGLPIANAVIGINYATLGTCVPFCASQGNTTTSATGSYTLTNVPQGTFTLSFCLNGCSTGPWHYRVDARNSTSLYTSAGSFTLPGTPNPIDIRLTQ